MNNQVCKNRSQSIPEIKEEHIGVIGEKESKLCKFVTENLTKKWTSLELQKMVRYCFSYIHAIIETSVTNKQKLIQNKLYIFKIFNKTHIILIYLGLPVETINIFEIPI